MNDIKIENSMQIKISQMATSKKRHMTLVNFNVKRWKRGDVFFKARTYDLALHK